MSLQSQPTRSGHLPPKPRTTGTNYHQPTTPEAPTKNSRNFSRHFVGWFYKGREHSFADDNFVHTWACRLKHYAFLLFLLQWLSRFKPSARNLYHPISSLIARGYTLDSTLVHRKNVLVFVRIQEACAMFRCRARHKKNTAFSLSPYYSTPRLLTIYISPRHLDSNARGKVLSRRAPHHDFSLYLSARLSNCNRTSSSSVRDQRHAGFGIAGISGLLINV